MGTTLFEQSNTVTDFETGEIRAVEKTIIKKVRPEEFVQVYLEDLSGLFKIDTKSELRLLCILWRDSKHNEEDTHEGNRIIIIKALKEEWAREIGINLQTVNNILTGLIKKELLIQKDRMLYYLNPKYFFKGSLKDKPKVIRTVLEYRLSSDPEQMDMF